MTLRTAAAALILLTVTPVVALPVVGPAGAAAAPTCLGERATIVGQPDGAVAGTPGRDVVVTNGASSTRTGTGDDLVCLTGTAAAAGLQMVDTRAGG